MQKLDQAEIKIGILSSNNPVHENSNLTLAEIAAVNEFGSDDGSIPERAAHRQCFQNHKKDTKSRMRKAAENIAEGSDIKKELDRVGLWYSGRLKKTIRDFDDPANAESTQLKKGANIGPGVMVDNPLIDTGRTIGAIQHETNL